VGIAPIQEKDDFYEDDGQPYITKLDLQAATHHTSKISNHYEVPNMSSMLYEFTNKEADRIH
jgi:hypothetical protein